jgi:hypothetical protein
MAMFKCMPALESMHDEDIPGHRILALHECFPSSMSELPHHHLAHRGLLNGPPQGLDLFLALPAKGRELEVGELYAGYGAWCDRSGKRVLTIENFAEAFAIICDGTGVRTRARGENVFCLDVKLA